jgi:hypothetical protein
MEYCDKLEAGLDKSSYSSQKTYQQIWRLKEKKDQAPSKVKNGLIVPTTGQLHGSTNIYKKITHNKCIRSK